MFRFQNKFSEELQQQHEYERQQLRSELTEEHEKKMSSMRRELEDLNENEECQFMDSLNVSKFNMSAELKKRELHEEQLKELKETHVDELKRLKKALDEELLELRQNLQNKV